MGFRTWVSLASMGMLVGCSGTSPSDALNDFGGSTPPTNNASSGGGGNYGGTSSSGSSSGTSGSSGASSGACRSCVTDSDCGSGAVCAQFDSDTYCAPLCNAGACASGASCATSSTASGQQVDACIPQGNPCGPASGSSSGGSGGGSGSSSGAGGSSGGGMCGSLAPPSVAASCNSCGSHACQANGCYGGWYCNTATSKCQSPPSTCGSGSSSGGSSGSSSGSSSGGGFDGGVPVNGTIGPNGGTVSRLYFAVIGDTRPATIDDTSAYPTSVISGIYSALAAFNPSPPFGVSTGDYMFATASGSQSGPQLDLYLAARSHFAGTMFPAMGNHECTGATASNCGSGNTDGVTNNYSAFLSKLLQPLGKTNPYYEIKVSAQDRSWTAKFLFVAANAWDSAQQSWMQSAMAEATTYTFVVRHEPAGTSGAPPGVAGSEAIMAQYPYTLSIVGHTHTYKKSGTKQITVGNGGAPLTGGVNYGFGLIGQRPDLSLTVDMIDYSTGQADASFHFAVKPDGTAAAP